MKSPFPGMDPYLEAHWLDVHARLVLYACDALQPQLGDGLKARVEERLIVEAYPEYERSVYPDIRIVRHPKSKRPISPAAAGVATAEPYKLDIPSDALTETFVKIIDARRGGEVVTVLEFLSPWNKTPGAGLDQYRQKQNELLSGGVSLVEIDLVRSGKRTFHNPLILIPPELEATYMVGVRRGFESGGFYVYPVKLREPLPGIRIPLRMGDPEVILDLQKVVEQAYENGAYDDIDYTKPPEPPLSAEDEKWADELLRGKELR